MSWQRERAARLYTEGPKLSVVAERWKRQKAAFLSIYGRDDCPTQEDAVVKTGIGLTTLTQLRATDADFSDEVSAIARRKQEQRRDYTKFSKASHVVELATKRRPKPGFEQWRREYIGRPVAPHQRDIVRAFEDRSNRRIIVLGPPSMGKDTTAGDFALYEVCDNPEARVAWLMRSEKFSRRRLAVRLAPYLIDPKTYLTSPIGPECTKPSRSLIEDWGPYRWERGMIYSDGTEVEKTIWNQHEMYFVGSGATEGDPNLWATGLGGALYGARTTLMVTSDIFDQKNQTPNQMPDQREYMSGTMDSRLNQPGHTGRYLHLGTRIHAHDNQQWIMDWAVGNSKPVYQEGNYTQYANGAATVIIKAIDYDDTGAEVSYWPDAFPLESRLVMPDGTVYESHLGLWNLWDTDPGYLAAKNSGAGEYHEGLYEKRNSDPDMFETMYQQNPPPAIAGEFADVVLDHCDDVTRTLGVHLPKEKLILGIDPARSNTTGWVLWGWDRDAGTITLVDFWAGSKLGIAGMVQHLLVEPMTRYMPAVVVYEDNRESAVLHFPEVQKALKDTAAQLVKFTTDRWNRGGALAVEGSAQVAAMVFDMRNGTIRFPAATMDDRHRVDQLKQHFRDWDRKQVMREAHQGSWYHVTDDLAMAAWVGWRHIKTLDTKSGRLVQRAVATIPKQVQRVFQGRVMEVPKERKEPLTDLIGAYWGEQ